MGHLMRECYRFRDGECTRVWFAFIEYPRASEGAAEFVARVRQEYEAKHPRREFEIEVSRLASGKPKSALVRFIR